MITPLIIGKLIVIGLAVAGFSISFYIYSRKKDESKKMVCIIGHDCNNVVGSKFGKTLGINNDKLGMIYYGFIGTLYLISLYYPSIFRIQYVVPATFAVVTVAAIFSVYLTAIQAFKLREFCGWCLTSAFISIAIFIIFVF